MHTGWFDAEMGLCTCARGDVHALKLRYARHWKKAQCPANQFGKLHDSIPNAESSLQCGGSNCS